MITFQDITSILTGEVIQESSPKHPIESLVTDSRKPTGRHELFIALKGPNHNGHDYIPELVKRGVKSFIVEEDIAGIKGVNIIKVKSSLNALQKIAAYKRSLFDIPVIGITGSNGKTIVKEWLGQLLSPYLGIKKNPGSYNSQIGTPLSVWQLREEDEIGIFEAGISKVGEMSYLANIIKPTFGIFTTIGTAHDEGFKNQEEKAHEKALLFKGCEKVIYCKEHIVIDQALKSLDINGLSWGYTKNSNILITSKKDHNSTSTLELEYLDKAITLHMPFTHDVHIENAMHCVASMLYLGYSEAEINNGLKGLKTPKMRLELKKGMNGCHLIDDSYNNDLAGLKVALDFLATQNQTPSKTVIISDILQSGLNKAKLYDQLSKLLSNYKIDSIVAIGPDSEKYLNDIKHITTYNSTQQFLKSGRVKDFREEVVLIKGARTFEFEKIVHQLESKIHGTQLLINLDAIASNLNFYRSKIKPETKMMVMVKAFAYGNGSVEVANLLQYHGVEYLGVAYADEGVFLRKNGIKTPIMVMNPSEDNFESMLEYDLEPELYNPAILKKYLHFIGKRKAAIHIKIDTGMHRLGFNADNINELISLLEKNKNIEVKTIFSHLAGADESQHNEYSRQQADNFSTLSDKIINVLGYRPPRHLANSPGIIRFPEYHFEMVRLGIGLYGIETTNQFQDQLTAISSLRTIVSQVNELQKGETVGYSRKGLATKPMKVATIAIGYADGYSRAFSNGVGQVAIKGQRAPVFGNVCMDMTMIDVTHIPNVAEGDEVEIFGDIITLREMAGFIDTIPYEILTNVSQRVKRVFYTQ